MWPISKLYVTRMRPHMLKNLSTLADKVTGNPLTETFYFLYINILGRNLIKNI